MELEKAEKKGAKASKSKGDEVSNVGENGDPEKDLEELKSRFEMVCTTFFRLNLKIVVVLNNMIIAHIKCSMNM